MRRKNTFPSGRSFSGQAFLPVFLLFLLAGPFLCSCDSRDHTDRDSGLFYPADEQGPFAVGVTTLWPVDQSRYEMWGRRPRVLPLEIWYPSTGIGGRANFMRDMVGELPQEAWPLLESIYGENLDEFWNAPTASQRDADILASSGPFPVIFFSHGYMGLRYQNFTLCEHLASHGFVVVSVDHYGNCVFVNVPDTPLVLFNPCASASAFFDRTQDVNFIFLELERMSQDALSAWHGLFDLDKFAISGHSYGGLTSLLCGADFDFVKAVAPLNPAWSGEFPKSFAKPFYMLQGENDRFVGSMNDTTRRLLEEAASSRKVFISLVRGGHYNATDVCTLVPPSITFLAEGCEPPSLDALLANQISNAYMTAFFKSALTGDHRYAAYLKKNHFPEEIELAVTWE